MRHALNSASPDAIFDAQEDAMRTTVTIDDKLLADAKELTGITETSRLVREALKLLVAREAGRRLAAMGGSQPDLEYVPRRRPPNFINDESDYPTPANAVAARKKHSAQ
jgi:Arc/MetJ family transcription regulator